MFRYKACKASAENLYARLATLSALQSYGLYLPSLMAAAAAASSSSSSTPNLVVPQPAIRHPEAAGLPVDPGFQNGFRMNKDLLARLLSFHKNEVGNDFLKGIMRRLSAKAFSFAQTEAHFMSKVFV